MKMVWRVVRRMAAIVNGLCVLALLALLAPAAGLLAARCLQNTACPAFGGWAVCTVEDGGMQPALCEGDLVVVRQRPEYPVGTLVACRGDSGPVFGKVLLVGSRTCTLGNAGACAVQAVGVPPEQMLGAAVARVPRVGGWLRWAQTRQGLCCLLAAGVLLAELPPFLAPRRRKKAMPPSEQSDPQPEKPAGLSAQGDPQPEG